MKAVKTLFFVLLIFSFVRVSAQETEGFIVDEIIAKIDNYIVMKSDLERAYQDYLINGGNPSEQARCQYLAMLIRNKLMMAKAEIDSVVVLDLEVDTNTKRRMDAIMAQAGNTPEELEAKFGKTLEQIQLELRDQIHEQMVVSKMEGKISEGLEVTPAEVKKFYNRFPKDSLPYFSAAVEVAQIVRVAKVSESQNDEIKKELMDIRSRILQGEDFATLAKKYSIDPTAKVNGGDMGFVGRGVMVPQFEAASFKLTKNEVSMPVKTQFGYHIIQLLERRGNEYHARHILMSPTPSDADLERAKDFLDSIKSLIEHDSLTFQKAAKEFSDDTPTKDNGGFFTDPDGGQKVEVDQLDPVVYFKLDSMQVGKISEPIVYRTDDGKTAARILFYKSRINPHVASLADDWHKIQTATINEKKDRLLQKWFKKARQDVFINIDPAYDYCGILNE